MGEIKVKDKNIVVPGEVLAVGMDYLPAGGAFRDDDEIIASQVGIVSISGRLIKLVPLNSKYTPKRGDKVIGKITDVSANAWFVDIGYYTEAAITLVEGSNEYIPRGADLTQYYAPGDYVIGTVTGVSRSNVSLTLKGPGLKKLGEGRIIYVNSAKVPRIIGKEGSMISMIKNMTDCRIIVGQNGMIWLLGADPEKEKLAYDAVKLIDERAHTQGLTDEIKKFLEEKIGGKK